MWHHFSCLLFAIRTLVAATTQDLEEEVEEEGGRGEGGGGGEVGRFSLTTATADMNQISVQMDRR